MTQPQTVGRLVPEPTPEYIRQLADNDSSRRAQVALDLFVKGVARVQASLQDWEKNDEFRSLVVHEKVLGLAPGKTSPPKLTVGIAVLPDIFEKIRLANGSPALANVPADVDVIEFELEFASGGAPPVRVDVLTTKAPDGNGAIARFLKNIGEGIQQVEIDVTDVDCATEILRTRFKIEPIYPATRTGAEGTRINFFLVPAGNNQKVLVEFVEQPKRT